MCRTDQAPTELDPRPRYPPASLACDPEQPELDLRPACNCPDCQRMAFYSDEVERFLRATADKR